MKNVHLIPTDKASRLYKDDNQVLTLNTHPVLKGIFTNGIGSNQHIYITSEEEIKEGDYGILDKTILSYHQMHKKWGMPQGKKIILTDDPDLIKDGIQSIDDDFLEWFVKNPSWTFFEDLDKLINKKKIIIPQEEPKQETIEEFAKGYSKDPFVVAGVITGATLQSARMYTEEEVRGMYESLWVGNCFDFDTEEEKQINFEKDFKEWFKKFKKQ